MPESSQKASIEFDVYIQFWCLHRLYETLGSGNQNLGWNVAEQVAITVLVLTTAVTKSVGCMVWTILLVLFIDAIKIPFVWDSEFWCMQTDLAILLAALATFGPKILLWGSTALPPVEELSLLYNSAADIVRRQMTVFYSAAAFWKLNSDFLNPHCSCAPIFSTQLVDLMWPSSVPMPDIVVWCLGIMSPVLVLLLEGGLTLGLVVKPRVGVAFALLLHLGIALCPPPNNVAPFSLMCATRLVVFVPTGAANSVVRGWTRTELALTVVAVAWACKLANHDFYFDVGLPLFVGLFPLMWNAVLLQPRKAFQHVAADQLKRPRLFLYSRRVLVAMALAYAYLAIPLGVQDQGQPHMYANLRMHGGSNHFLFPTALLQKAYQHTTSSLGGGIVRIEKTDSKYFNELCPSDYTKDLSLRTRRWLHVAGHSGLMFNPMLTAVASSEATWDESKGPFIKYTIPAHEFRRMLAVARGNNETFSLVYTQLFDYGNDEWRSVSPGRTVQLFEDTSKGVAKCKVKLPQAGKCTPADLPNLPPLSWWARKLLLFEAYPIIPNDYSLQCFGP